MADARRSTWRRALAALALATIGLTAAGCRTFDPQHPLKGKPDVDLTRPAYWIWVEDNVWHVRVTAGSRPRRFQGSLTGVNGAVTDLALTRPELADRVALSGSSVQFDIDAGGPEGPKKGADGFSARVLGGCAKIDVLIDGRFRPELVRFGPRGEHPRYLPTERCP
jgi:hypothetical protein